MNNVYKKLVSIVLLASATSSAFGYIGYKYQFKNDTVTPSYPNGVPVEVCVKATLGNDQCDVIAPGETKEYRTGVACSNRFDFDALLNEEYNIHQYGTTAPGVTTWPENKDADGKSTVAKSMYTIPTTGAGIMCGSFAKAIKLTAKENPPLLALADIPLQ